MVVPISSNENNGVGVVLEPAAAVVADEGGGGGGAVDGGRVLGR